MTFVCTCARRPDVDVRNDGPRNLGAEYSGQPFGRNCIRRTGDISEEPCLWPHQTLESNAPSDFQRCQGRTCRCTHYPAPCSTHLTPGPSSILSDQNLPSASITTP